MPTIDAISDVAAQTDLSTPQGRARVAATLTRQLQTAVGRLLALYEVADENDAEGNRAGGVLNMEQPDAAPHIYAGSLDEWFQAIDRVGDQWEIAAQTPEIWVDVNRARMRLAAFFTANADGIRAEERAAIVRAIEAGETYQGGGGAAEEFRVSPVNRASPWLPVRFTFDGEGTPTFEGETAGGRWNGSPIVRVTGSERVKLALWALRIEGEDAAQYVAEMLAAEPDPGEADRYTLAGFTPYILEGAGA